MRILVTGGSGCVGKRLIEVLVENNHEIIAPVRDPNSLNDLIGCNIGCNRCHVVASESAISEMPFDSVDVVVHSAAIHPATGRKFSDNVQLTESALEFAKILKAKQFILISSVAVYGDLYEGQRCDDAPICPDSAYGRSKSESEEITIAFCRKNNIPHTVFRPGMIYGPYDRGLILKYIKLIHSGIIIRFGDGNNKRSLVCNETIARIVLCSLLNKKFYGNSFILVNRKAFSINEIIDEIASLLGKKPFKIVVPNWLLHSVGFLLSVLNSLRISTPVNWFDLKKQICSAYYAPQKLEDCIGGAIEEDFRKLLGTEVNWYLAQRGLKAAAEKAASVGSQLLVPHYDFKQTGQIAEKK